MVTSLALVAVVPVLLGLTSTVVMSDSMAPGIRAGDVVVVRATPIGDIHVGQVLLVNDPSFPGRLRLHRLAERDQGRFVLKGDANAQRDPTPVTAAAVHGVGFLRVPWIALPLLWIRTGDPLLTVIAAIALGGAALVVTLLDESGAGIAVRVARRLGRLAMRAGRGRLIRFGVVGALIALPTVHANLDIVPASWAAFTGTTSSPSNAFRANSTFASSSCWSLPSPTPNIAYSFSAANGTAESNVGSAGSQTAYDAALSTASLRVSGTCASGSGPSVHFSGSGSEAVVSTGTFAASSSGTDSLWFFPTTTKGVLFDQGSQAGNDAAQTDRQLYFTSSGGLAFVMKNGSSPVTCTVTTSVATGTWHFAAVSYDSTTEKFLVYYDGSTTTCTGTITTAPTVTSYGRVGSDVAIASNASTGAYAGGIDEVYEWAAVLTATQIGTVYAAGH